MLQLTYSETYGYAIDREARFPRSRYWKVYESLAERAPAEGIADRLDVVAPRPAERSQLVRVHDADYVDAFLEGTLDDQMVRRIGFRPWTEGFVERTLAITGGSLMAVEAVLDGALVAGNLAGGTHHAFRARGGGYCVFNDIAIGVEMARQAGVERVAVVDLDVHQGDGTAALLGERGGVMCVSVHCAQNYPFRKQQSDLDVPVEEGTADRGYLGAVDEAVAAVEAWEPQLVFFQAGVDGLEADTLGRLRLTRGGLRRRNRRVFGLAERLQAGVVVLMGGGYAEPIEASVRAHGDVFLAAARHLDPAEDAQRTPSN